MKKLVSGVEQFRSGIVGELQESFAHLGKGQSPQAVFITCSDSRINPNLLTQTAPGDLFIVRNAGNIVPPWGSLSIGEIATIEFAVGGLGIEDIIVCGHSHCGAMQGLLKGGVGASMPTLGKWLELAEPTRRIVLDTYGDRNPEEQLSVAIQENVLCQIANLRTHPVVASRLLAGKVRLHAWVYKITTGEVFSFDASEGQFRPLREVRAQDAPRAALANSLIGP